MTNLNRIKLELANKSYFTDEEYSIFLEENGLTPTEEYTSFADKLRLLQTVISVLESLQNNIDLFRKVETEFSNTTSAYENIKDRIESIYRKISVMPNYQPTKKSITYLFHN